MMKLTDDIVKALQRGIIRLGSVTELSRRTGVKIETISRFLTRKTQSVGNETMEKLAPFLIDRDDMAPEPPQVIGPAARCVHDLEHLTGDEKILLDAFNALPQELGQTKLLEIIDLAQAEVEKARARL